MEVEAEAGVCAIIARQAKAGSRWRRSRTEHFVRGLLNVCAFHQGAHTSAERSENVKVILEKGKGTCAGGTQKTHCAIGSLANEIGNGSCSGWSVDQLSRVFLDRINLAILYRVRIV